jgi:hypothetical protein
MLFEMGYKPHEVDAVQMADFNFILTGYYRSQEREANLTRHIVWAVIQHAGMGRQEKLSPKDIWPLNMDTEDEKKMITSLKMALDLLKEF